MIATLTARPDFGPVPRVEVRLQSLTSVSGGTPSQPGGTVLSGGTPSQTGDVVSGGTPGLVNVTVPDDTERVTLWRRSEGRAMKVRGVVDRPYSDAFGVLDLEAPFNTPASYELECFRGGQAVARVTLGTAVLPGLEGPSYRTLIQQPLAPRLHAVVEDVDVNVPTLSRSARGEAVTTEGGSLPRFVGFGPQSGVQGARLLFAADTREIAADVWATRGTEEQPQLPVWLVRSNHPLLPKVFFCHVPELNEVTFDLHIGGVKSRFEATVDEIAPPAPALAAPTLTYSDLAAAFGGTWSGIAEGLPRYSQWSTAWEFAGAAG